MKKQQKCKPLITSQASAVTAFARGDKLPIAERKRVMARYYKATRLSLKTACLGAIRYSFGLINETGEELIFLTKVWLRLGETMWRKLINAARLFPQASFFRFCAEFRRLICCRLAWTW